MYTLWYTNIAMENHHFQWVNPLQMAIFHSYVSLPEGNNTNNNHPNILQSSQEQKSNNNYESS